MYTFNMPSPGEGAEDADVAEVHVAVGDTIDAETEVIEVETEKAAVGVPVDRGGKVVAIHVKPGDTIKVGAPVLDLEESSEAGTSNAPKDEGPKEEPKPAPAAKSEPAPQPTATSPAGGNGSAGSGSPVPPTTTASSTREGAVLATTAESRAGGPPPPAAPSTRRLARKLGVDLHAVAGSGTGGRITQEDVQGFVRSAMAGGGTLVPAGGAAAGVTTAMAAPTLPDFTKYGAITREKMNKIARTSANNLTYAWNTIPHVTQHDLVDVTDIEAARKQYMSTLGKNGPKITMTAIAAKACVTALRAYPHFNSSIDLGTGELILKQYYNIGIAVDTPNGLLVPVVRDCDQKSVVEIAAEITDLAERARDRKVSMDDLQGATFTITNLGGIGGTSFTPIVNYPEVAILGMSRYTKTPAVENGQLVERLMLPLSLSYDHRVVNGADAARFIVKLNHALSNFFTLAIEG